MELKNGEFDKAVASLDKAIETNNGNAQAHTLKGDVLMEQAQRKANPADRLSLYEGMVSSYKTAQTIYDTTNQKPQAEILKSKNSKCLGKRAQRRRSFSCN